MNHTKTEGETTLKQEVFVKAASSKEQQTFSSLPNLHAICKDRSYEITSFLSELE
jgi:hypothetical protein